MSERSPYRQNAAPPAGGDWFLQIWKETFHYDGDATNHAASAARLLGDRMIWFTGAEENWTAAGVKPTTSESSAEMLAHTLRALPAPQQTKALEAMVVAAAARSEDQFWDRPVARSLSRDCVRARLHAAGARPKWIDLFRQAGETHTITPTPAELDALERWCAAGRPQPITAPLDVELLHLQTERQDPSVFQLLRDKWLPLGSVVIAGNSLRWTGSPGAERAVALHEDVRSVLPAGLRLRVADVGAIESVRRILGTPVFQHSMAAPPFVRRVIRNVEQYTAREFRGVLPPELSGFLLDDELVCFKGDDRAWNAALQTDGEWVDSRASTLAAMLVWLPESEQIAAIERIAVACEHRPHMLKTFPRDVVKRWLGAARSSQRIALVDDPGDTQFDLLPTPEELSALRAWAG